VSGGGLVVIGLLVNAALLGRALELVLLQVRDVFLRRRRS